MARERTQEGPLGRRCLYCASLLPPLDGARVHCAACERVNTKADLQDFLTRCPAWVRFERTLKFVWALGVAGAAGWIVWMTWKGGNDPRYFMFGGAGLCLGAWFLWETASHVTRRRVAFDPTIAWPGLVLAVGLVPLLVGILFLSGKVMAFGAVATAAALVPAWATRKVTLAIGRWRAEKYAALLR